MSGEETQATPVEPENQEEEILYHAVEKEGVITAIWVMKGKKHLKTIDPNSKEGLQILDQYKPTEKTE